MTYIMWLCIMHYIMPVTITYYVVHVSMYCAVCDCAWSMYNALLDVLVLSCYCLLWDYLLVWTKCFSMIEHRLYLMCTGIGLCYFHRIALFLKHFYARCGSLFIMFAHSSFCVRALSADITVLSETCSYSIIKFSFYYSIVGINCPSMVFYTVY